MAAGGIVDVSQNVFGMTILVDRIEAPHWELLDGDGTRLGEWGGVGTPIERAVPKILVLDEAGISLIGPRPRRIQFGLPFVRG